VSRAAHVKRVRGRCGGLRRLRSRMFGASGSRPTDGADGDVFTETNLTRQLNSNGKNLGAEAVAGPRASETCQSQVSVTPVCVHILPKQTRRPYRRPRHLITPWITARPGGSCRAARINNIPPWSAGHLGGGARVFVLLPGENADFL
jgi:hypothetical protein